ncbi:MAG: YlxR family protein [Dehalococcoidia bacterium]|jgi:predicted RNA-binding protein YlxR (DUF448 family)|nr:YlxR family protein [Chloroflexota bacterium]MCK4243106.1 YlxR family protein [Dehalococcoidia bacterium]
MTTTSQRKKNIRQRHIPQRTCAGCRQVRPKRELIRIVRTATGAVEIDPTGKKSGRGVYLCQAKSCWQAGLKGEHLDRALRTKITPQNRRELALYGEMFT